MWRIDLASASLGEETLKPIDAPTNIKATLDHTTKPKLALPSAALKDAFVKGQRHVIRRFHTRHEAQERGK